MSAVLHLHAIYHEHNALTTRCQHHMSIRMHSLVNLSMHLLL